MFDKIKNAVNDYLDFNPAIKHSHENILKSVVNAMSTDVILANIKSEGEMLEMIALEIEKQNAYRPMLRERKAKELDLLRAQNLSAANALDKKHAKETEDSHNDWTKKLAELQFELTNSFRNPDFVKSDIQNAQREMSLAMSNLSTQHAAEFYAMSENFSDKFKAAENKYKKLD